MLITTTTAADTTVNISVLRFLFNRPIIRRWLQVRTVPQLLRLMQKNILLPNQKAHPVAQPTI